MSIFLEVLNAFQTKTINRQMQILGKINLTMLFLNLFIHTDAIGQMTICLIHT